MLPAWWIIFAIVLRLFASGQYIWGIFKGKARPNPVSWLLWGITPLIALAAQWQQGWNVQSLILVALAVGPLTVFIVGSLKTGLRQYLTPFTWWCVGVSGVGIVLWQVTAIAELALAFSILADIAANLPTLRKAYKDPKSEYAFPFMISIASMIITLLTIQSWNFITYGFPLYLLLINFTLVVFATVPLGRFIARIRLRFVI